MDYTEIEISQNLKDELQKMATEKNTNIDNVIKGIITDNKILTTNPDNYLADTKVSTKDNKNKKGEVTSQTHSTVIPKPIINKLGLQHQQVLYWDITDNKILITPEVQKVPTPEEASIQAGYDMLKDILEKQQGNFYSGNYINICNWLDMDKTDKEKLKHFKTIYKEYDEIDKAKYTRLITYLLDYPLPADHHKILQAVYDEIIKTD